MWEKEKKKKKKERDILGQERKWKYSTKRKGEMMKCSRGLKGERRATENLIKKENNRRAEKDRKRTESRKV